MSDEVKRDEYGIMISSEMLKERKMTRERWLEECFPPWGIYLNREMAETKVGKGKLALWWFGGPSWGLKAGNDVFFIDNYAGPSTVSIYENCGVCQTAGSPMLHWLRLNPQVIDPWKMKKVNRFLLDASPCGPLATSTR